MVRMSVLWRGLASIAMATTAAAWATGANAASAVDFYKGRTVTFTVGVGAGGNFALYARLFAPYLSRHVAGNPNVVVQYMPGASGRKAASYMHNAAAKDGSVIAMTLHTVPFSQKIRPKGAKYDATKWNWIGRLASLNSAVTVSHTAPATTLEAAKKKEVILGASSKASSAYIDPALVNMYLGTKFRVVFGYRGAGGMSKAMEGGETHGATINILFWKSARAEMVRTGKVRFLIQFGHERDPDLPDVPLLTDLLTDAHAKRVARFAATPNQIARAIFAPPGVPADRVAALRAGFDAAVKDPDFLADAAKRRVPVIPMDGAGVAKLVAQLVNAPDDVVAEVQKTATLQ